MVGPSWSEEIEWVDRAVVEISNDIKGLMAGVAAIYVARLAFFVPLRAWKAILSGIATAPPSILTFCARLG